MIKLTEQQQAEIDKSGWPPRVLNPGTQESFVLIHAEMFERVRALLEAEDEIAAVREMYPLVNQTLEGDEEEVSREIP